MIVLKNANINIQLMQVWSRLQSYPAISSVDPIRAFCPDDFNIQLQCHRKRFDLGLVSPMTLTLLNHVAILLHRKQNRYGLQNKFEKDGSNNDRLLEMITFQAPENFQNHLDCGACNLLLISSMTLSLVQLE